MHEDAAISDYLSLHPEQFPVLKKMEFFQHISQRNLISVDLEVISGRPIRSTDKRELRIVFYDVINLNFSYKSPIVGFNGFDISFIRDRQWERYHYEVKEGGHGIKTDFISFFCNSFESMITESA